MGIMNSFKEDVRDAVTDAMAKIGATGTFDIEIPSTDAADLAVPCFGIAKAMRRPPADVAKEIASAVHLKGTMSSVSALNGYLNFIMSSDALISGTMSEILEKKDGYGYLPSKNKKINVEHTSTNPTGPIHVGRARNPIIGDTLARCLERCGYDVTTEYYVNDVGKQVVILTWGINNSPKDAAEKEGREKNDHSMVAFYRLANKMMESDPKVSEEISSMLRRFEDGDAEVISSVRRTTEMMLAGLKETLDSIGVELDVYTWESRYIENGDAKRVVEDLKRSKYAGKEDDGAWYLDLEEFGVHGNNKKFTFTRSDGTTLYTTRDIAYHIDKLSKYDRVIGVLGEDQKLGSKQLLCALQILSSEKMPEPMFYSFVSLPEGKMSTRKGVVVYLDDLIDESVEYAYKEIKARREDLSEEKMRYISKIVGIGAIRYNIVRIQPEKQFVFKWSEALNFDGNSGPFLQYSHARACSILRKAGSFRNVTDPSKLTDEYEIKLIKSLSKFESVMEAAGEGRKIHIVPAYGHEVASAFNQFYVNVPVLNSGASRDARLTLVECTKTVLNNILDCLGMGAPEEM
ncbi:MAG: arginine--tRNA ligase [Methanomassiliicoccaceae archaeon]|jgi:arginyl-tRNA synthetase|nr:arginine--tRNA ligase [Methanomassiliicoccaceae archaeon]